MAKDSKSGYYDAGGIEVLDIIKAKLTPEQYFGYLIGNAIKYNCRLNFKHDFKERHRDLEKAANYTKWAHDFFPQLDRPKIVCLCGSTKFKDDFIELNERLTLDGHIVLSVGLFGHADKHNIDSDTKNNIDDLHKQKIKLADEIIVVNTNGYIGESTQSEIVFAKMIGKKISYMYTYNED